MARFTHTIDPDALRHVCPNLSRRRARKLAKAIGTALHRFEPGVGQRACAHFVGQCAHETGEFRWLREIWGPTATQAGYWDRRELQGPGRLYRLLGYLARGGGFVMTTGRAHFRTAARRLGRRSWLLLANQSGWPRIAALLAAIWWADHFPASMPAIDWDVERVTRTVNGGTNGLAERRVYTARAMRVRGRLLPRRINR
jgi:putative chitinase